MAAYKTAHYYRFNALMATLKCVTLVSRRLKDYVTEVSADVREAVAH